MAKKVEETIVIRNSKMVYAVRLVSKLEEGDKSNSCAPYLIAEDGKIKFVDRFYDKNEFNFADEVHQVAKEVFVSNLRASIKEQILQLKQLQLVLEELGLTECIGNTLEESATFLQKIKKFVGVEALEERD